MQPEPPADRALLTGGDARAVVRSHLILFNVIAKDDDGGYTIVSWRYNPDLLRNEELRGHSESSWEDAVMDLAAKTRVYIPLNDPGGFFMRVRRHRAGLVQQLLDVRDAELCEEDFDQLETLAADVQRLRTAVRPRVVLDHTKVTPPVWIASIYGQAMLHRLLSLLESMAAAWNAGNGLAACVLSRCALETVAVWVYACQMADRRIRSQEFDGYDELIWRVFFGQKKEKPGEEPLSNLQPISVLTALQKLDKEVPGTLKAYDELCEIAHPNGESLYAVCEWGWGEEWDVGFHTRAFSRGLLSRVLSGLKLKVAFRCFEIQQELEPVLNSRWRERYGLPPSGK